MSRWKLLGALAVAGIGMAMLAGGGLMGAESGQPPWTAAAAAAASEPGARPTSHPRLITPNRGFQLDPPPALSMPYFNTEGGYWLQLPGRWVAMGKLFGQGCAFDFCGAGVSVDFGPARSGLRVETGEPGELPIVIRGRTLRAVKASWKAAYPDAEFRPRAVDGFPGLLASAPAEHGSAVLVLNRGRLFMFRAYAIWDGATGDMLRQFLSGFHFMPASCWIEPCRDNGWWAPADPLVAMKSAQGWISEGSQWGVGPGPGDRSIAAFASNACFAELCAGYVAVTIGTRSTGPVVDRYASASSVSWRRAAGTTLAQVAASTAEIIGATRVDRLKVDGVPARRLVADGREVVVLEHRGRFVVITAFDGYGQLNAGVTLKSFLTRFELVD